MCNTAYARAKSVVLDSMVRVGIATRLAKPPAVRESTAPRPVQKPGGKQHPTTNEIQRRSRAISGLDYKESIARLKAKNEKEAAEKAAKRKAKNTATAATTQDIEGASPVIERTATPETDSADAVPLDDNATEKKQEDAPGTVEKSLENAEGTVEKSLENAEGTVEKSLENAEGTMEGNLEDGTYEYANDENTETLAETLSALNGISSARVTSDVNVVNSGNWRENLLMFYYQEINDDAKREYTNLIAAVSR